MKTSSATMKEFMSDGACDRDLMACSASSRVRNPLVVLDITHSAAVYWSIDIS
jgi:hypothetical protein